MAEWRRAGLVKGHLSYLQRTDNDKFKMEDFCVWLFAGWTHMAMTDYSYPTKFLKPLPGWPVKQACKYLSDVSHFQTDRALLKGVFKAISVYYSHTGAVKTCFNQRESSTDRGWSTSLDLRTSHLQDPHPELKLHLRIIVEKK